MPLPVSLHTVRQLLDRVDAPVLDSEGTVLT